MHVRKANKTDKIQIQALDEELNLYRRNNFSPSTKEFHERVNPYEPVMDNDFTDSVIFVAIDEDDTIVGFVRGSVTERSNHKLSKLGYIDELFVKEEARGKGAAKELFSALESEFKSHGCDLTRFQIKTLGQVIRIRIMRMTCPKVFI